jgi:hypothetical protein
MAALISTVKVEASCGFQFRSMATLKAGLLRHLAKLADLSGDDL